MRARAARRPRVAAGVLVAAALAAGLAAGAGRSPAAGPTAVWPVRVAASPPAFATAFAAGDGRLVTVAHVLRGGRPVTVAGRPARVLRVDGRLDVAVLAAPGVGGAPPRGDARAGDRATVRVLRAAGARSLPVTVRRTITARLGRAVRPALELDGAVQPGDSGAPVLDAGGHLLGVVFAQSAGRRRVYAVDASALGSLAG